MLPPQNEKAPMLFFHELALFVIKTAWFMKDKIIARMKRIDLLKSYLKHELFCFANEMLIVFHKFSDCCSYCGAGFGNTGNPEKGRDAPGISWISILGEFDFCRKCVSEHRYRIVHGANCFAPETRNQGQKTRKPNSLLSKAIALLKQFLFCCFICVCLCGTFSARELNQASRVPTHSISNKVLEQNVGRRKTDSAPSEWTANNDAQRRPI